MRALLSLSIVVALAVLALLGAGAANLHFLFGVIIPYAALTLFVGGCSYRVLKWGRAPVPFRITTTCGQQKSLPWIKDAPLDCPSGTWGVVGRMALEVLFFRSLFRNTNAKIAEGRKVVYESNKLLWLAALAFHWSLLVILIRHGRFFVDPAPSLVGAVERLDGFFRVGLPIVYATDVVVVVSLTYLVLRRLLFPRVRYISLGTDYFPLFLMLGIASSGIDMRYGSKVDIAGVKAAIVGLLSFHPVVPEGIGAVFYVHLFLVCVLAAYFPFSKLMHAGGVFLSPTRNLANDSRARRHVNPWDTPVKVHSYEAYEDEFREKMAGAGIPVDRES